MCKSISQAVFFRFRREIKGGWEVIILFYSSRIIGRLYIHVDFVCDEQNFIVRLVDFGEDLYFQESRPQEMIIY